MTPASFLASLLVGAGLAGVVVAAMLRSRERGSDLADWLDAPGSHSSPAAFRAVGREAAPGHRRRVLHLVGGMAGGLVDRVDRKGALARALERAEVALRPGEFAAVTGGAGVAAGALAGALAGSVLLGLAVVAAGPVVGLIVLRRRWVTKQQKFDEQLPDALSLIAASLAAGHTFLRAMQMMCEEAQPPLAEEFGRVVREVQLGAQPVDAMAAMAERLGLRDLGWVVQAIAIQQQVGGRLAELLHTLADFMRGRQEVRREVHVLTAEGRMSAVVLAALPVLLFVALDFLNPKYLQPLLHGMGVLALGGCALSTAAGFVVIRRQVRIEV